MARVQLQLALVPLLFAAACGGSGAESDSSALLNGSQSEHKANNLCGTPDAPLRIMPLGDSITESAAGHSSYRKPLFDMLVNSGCAVDFVGSRHGVSDGKSDGREVAPPDTDFDQDHEGHWGYRTDEVLEFLVQWAADAAPDVVLVHLGSNDIFQHQSVESTLNELKQVVEVLRSANPEVQILLAQLIPSSRSSETIEVFNSQLPALAKSLDTALSRVEVVDQHSEFYISSDTFDHIHPNGSGELKMAGRWFNALMELLYS